MNNQTRFLNGHQNSQSFTHIEAYHRSPPTTEDSLIGAAMEGCQDWDNVTVELPSQLPWFRRMWKYAALMHYYRLFFLVIMANMGILWVALSDDIYPLRFMDVSLDFITQPLHVVSQQLDFREQSALVTISQIANLVLVNIAIAIFVRQQHVINLFFRLATSIPTRWPLSIRRRLGKIYHFGGLHVGCAVAGTLWLAGYTGLVAFSLELSSQLPFEILLINYGMLGMMITMIIFALPPLRNRFHNLFEKSHRFMGWSLLIAFWTQSVITELTLSEATDPLHAFFSLPTTWILVLITFSIALPWFHLRKVNVTYEKPSEHAVIAHFQHGVTPFAGSSTVLSRRPLFEWHAFANIVEPNKTGFRLAISRAGDWTGQLIDELPNKLWVKGVPTAGVGHIDKLFRRVVWVATGSGIGPCLPHLISGDTPSLLVWATRNPEKTYGEPLLDEIKRSQPNARIWDTSEKGKPDMVKLAYQAYRDFNAEAVICISNKKLTWVVVEGLETRGIPAYGAIWDS